MKTVALLLLALEGASAFPFVLDEVLNSPKSKRGVTGSGACSVSALCNQYVEVTNEQISYDPQNPTPLQLASKSRQNCGALTPCSVFDADEQFVSTTGEHAWQSPAATDLRGPCPGLNAAANHGYLERSGVQTITSTINGLSEAYAMAPELAAVLAVYGIVIDGDLTSLTWSIGGPQAGATFLDDGQGISWSHNKYEGDTSIGRCDAYINNGDAHSLSPTRFAYAIYEGLDDDSYTMDNLARAFTKNTFRSISQNPYYFAPLFSTTVVSPAAYNFVLAFMSNHSAESIGGYLNQDIMKSFFAMEGTYPNYKWLPGQERIPENWYRRPSSTPYTTVKGIVGDVVAEYLAYPDSLRFGGNTNGVNTYTGIDIENFTGGVYNAGSLLEGNNFACFLYQNLQQGQPDVLNHNPLTTAATTLLDKYLGASFAGLGCPALAAFNDNNLPPYTGRSYSPDPPANAQENC